MLVNIQQCNVNIPTEIANRFSYRVSSSINKHFFFFDLAEVGSMTAPALIAGTLNSTSLSLEWDIPKRLTEITKTNMYHQSYLVQWRYEEVAGDWKFCRNQSMGENSTIKVENLHPYTKYRVSS